MTSALSAVRNIARERCFNHAQREAVARCPHCTHFYCRECITELDDRIICAVCLKKMVRQSFLQRRAFVGIIRTLQCLFGVLTLWFFFYLIGEGLLRLPTSFHEGTLWRVDWLDRK
jgi:hypothetical protein